MLPTLKTYFDIRDRDSFKVEHISQGIISSRL